jgi:hypothetical protein
MAELRRGPGLRTPGARQIKTDYHAQPTTDLQARIGTATRVATRWLLGEPITDDELAALVRLLDRCECDAA